MHKLSHTPPTFSTSMEHGAFKRPRSGSISSRLRSASDLCDDGHINMRQKGVLKDMIIAGEPDVEAALMRHRSGDPSAAGDLQRLAKVDRKSSLDLLGFNGDLNLDFLNVGMPDTPALGSLNTPKLGGEMFAMDVEGALDFTIGDGVDENNHSSIERSLLSNIPLVHVRREDLSEGGESGHRSRKTSFAHDDDLDFPLHLLEGYGIGVGNLNGMPAQRLHRDSISAIDELAMEDFGTPQTGPHSGNGASFGFGFATSPRHRSFSRSGTGASRDSANPFSSAMLPPPASSTTKTKTKKSSGGSSRSKSSAQKIKKNSTAKDTKKRSPASSSRARSTLSTKSKSKARTSPMSIPGSKSKSKKNSSYRGGMTSPAGRSKLKSMPVLPAKPGSDEEYDTGERAPGAPQGNVGAYSPESRRARIAKFLDKRQHRIWKKRVKYDVRKNFADSRLRVKGRFVKKEDEELLRDLMNMI